MDLNPLHVIDELNNAIGKDTASVLEFLHLTDPAVKPDGVRDVAKKWQALAKSVDDAQHQANTALKDVVWEGKAADVADQDRKGQHVGGFVAHAHGSRVPVPRPPQRGMRPSRRASISISALARLSAMAIS